MQLKLKWIETETTLTMTTLTTLSLCDYCDWVPKLPKAAQSILWQDLCAHVKPPGARPPIFMGPRPPPVGEIHPHARRAVSPTSAGCAQAVARELLWTKQGWKQFVFMISIKNGVIFSRSHPHQKLSNHTESHFKFYRGHPSFDFLDFFIFNGSHAISSSLRASSTSLISSRVTCRGQSVR